MQAQRTSARDYFPATLDLEAMCAAAKGCRGCDLWERATQTVFGEGSDHARVRFVGEQPGDAEDVAGHPFVGPAGGLLDEVLEEAGIDRGETWVTNAVKHFKWEPKGKKRMHVKPTMLEVTACRPWLDAEIQLIAPEVVVPLGATAAQSLLGRGFRISRTRGEWADWERPQKVLATWHPSAVLRAPEREDRHRMRAEMVADLRKVARSLR
jgi:DNA polymerase